MNEKKAATKKCRVAPHHARPSAMRDDRLAAYTARVPGCWCLRRLRHKRLNRWPLLQPTRYGPAVVARDAPQCLVAPPAAASIIRARRRTFLLLLGLVGPPRSPGHNEPIPAAGRLLAVAVGAPVVGVDRLLWRRRRLQRLRYRPRTESAGRRSRRRLRYSRRAPPSASVSPRSTVVFAARACSVVSRARPTSTPRAAANNDHRTRTSLSSARPHRRSCRGAAGVRAAALEDARSQWGGVRASSSTSARPSCSAPGGSPPAHSAPRAFASRSLAVLALAWLCRRGPATDATSSRGRPRGAAGLGPCRRRVRLSGLRRRPARRRAGTAAVFYSFSP